MTPAPPSAHVIDAPPDRYGGGVIALHWLALVLIAGAYATIELREFYPRDSPERALLRLWHYGFGLAALAATLVRMLARASRRAPAIVPPPPVWQEELARFGHIVLYALMLGLPILGWLALGAEGRPVALAGVMLPMLTGPDQAWVKPLEKTHEIAGQAGYALIGLHAAAALWHHYVMRDNTLALMWPFARAPRRDAD